MTENEAKEMLAIHYEFLRESWKPYPDRKVLDAIRAAISSIDKIQQYREIGTVEECREARERQMGKKPKHQGCYDDNGAWHEWDGINGKPYELCPNCGINLCCEMPYDRKPKYCDNCGQKLDWPE